MQIWLEEQGENSFAISAYCEKLLPMLREEESRAWWMLTTLTDQVLGEIPHMRYIDSFDVLEEPKACLLYTSMRPCVIVYFFKPFQASFIACKLITFQHGNQGFNVYPP